MLSSEVHVFTIYYLQAEGKKENIISALDDSRSKSFFYVDRCDKFVLFMVTRGI